MRRLQQAFFTALTALAFVATSQFALAATQQVKDVTAAGQAAASTQVDSRSSRYQGPRGGSR